jgi:hypothetical protein
MQNKRKRLRAALGMGVTWAFGWALAGIVIGVATLLIPGPWSVFGDDGPAVMLAIPGFFAGTIFSLVLGVAGRRHGFGDLSLPRFTAWGAVGGVLLSLVPLALLALSNVVITLVGETPPDSGITVGVIAKMAGTFMLCGAVSAYGTLVLARRRA